MPFINRYSNTIKGAMTFTGNTAGLSKLADANLVGTVASIGAFSSLNTGLTVGDFPAGTTLNIVDNGSQAQLVLPAGSTVVYAELVWGGNYFGRDGNNNNTVDISGLINNPVVFTTPAGTTSISPDPATAQTGFASRSIVGFPFPFQFAWYERSRNVTALVQAGGVGTYSVQQITGLTEAIDTQTVGTNHAGWTLAVVYANATLPFRNMNLYVGAELIDLFSNPVADVPIGGFLTPPTGPVTARLLISAQEGDASGNGDRVLFGPDTASLAVMSGPNNVFNNFFASQINNDTGNLNTTGTFGNRNQDPFTGTNIPGGRQGWDITNIDASTGVSNGQTAAVIRFTTMESVDELGESYMPDMLGLQIDASAADVSIAKVGAPNPVIAGEQLTYTLVVNNAGPYDATNTIVTDALPVQLSNTEYSLNGGGTWLPWPGVLNLGTVNIGVPVTILLRGDVSSDTTGTLTNTASVTSDALDPDPSNNTATATVQVEASADVAVVKTAITNPAVAGQLFMYNIAVTNNGPSDAQGVVLSDIPPAILQNPEYSLNGGTTWIAWLGTLPIGTLVAGSTVNVEFRGTIAASATGIMTNTATVAATTQDPDPTNNTSTVVTQVTTLANVSIQKTASPNPVTAGNALTYTIEVSNSGPSNALNVTVTDAVPTSMVGVTYSVDGGTTWLAWTGSYTIGTVVVGESKAFLIRGTVDANTTQNITNTAVVTTTTPNSNPNNRSSVTTLINNAEIIKSSNVQGALVGDTITYTLKITNKGQVTEENIVVKDVLTPEVAYANNLRLNGVPIGGDVTLGVNIGNLVQGQTAMLTFEGTVSSVPLNPEKLTINQASIDYQYRALPTDPPINAVKLSNPNPVRVYTPGLDVIKKASSLSVVVGVPFTYTLTVTNTGDIDINHVIVSDTLPAGFIVQSIQVDGVWVTGNIQTGIDIGTIVIGSHKVVELTILVDEIVAIANFNNVALANGTATVDPNRPLAPISDTGRDDEGIKIYDPTLTLVKSANKKNVVVGDTVTYSVKATNEGNSALNNVQLDQVVFFDILPSQVEFIVGTVRVDGIPFPEANVLSGVSLGTLGINESKTITFDVKVISDEGTPVENMAQAEYFSKVPGLPVLSNVAKSNIYELNVFIAKLNVEKTADPKEVALGDTITYTVQITNEGNLTAYNVLFKDQLPAQTQLIPGSFKLDNQVINGVELDKGIIIPVIAPGESVTITYNVKVIGSNCSGVLINQAQVKFDYLLPDGTGGTMVEQGESASTQTDLEMSQFKQMSIESYLSIPEVKPDIEAINVVTGSIDKISCHVIETSKGTSTEGQQLTGNKLIVRGELNVVIEYTALEETQSVHSAHYTVPFSTFIILPFDYEGGSKLEITGLVEDVYYKAADIRNFFVNITALINAKILSC